MSILPRDQVVVAADGTISVESVATFDATVSDGFSLTVSTRDAPDVDRTFVEADGTLTVVEGVGASAFASSPAPAGYRWEFVTENGVRVTDNNEPVVDLVRIN